MTDASTPAAAATRPGPADMIEIYYAPSDVFERRRDGGFGVPLIVYAVAITAIYYATQSAMQPLMDIEFSRAVAAMRQQNPGLTDDQVEVMRKAGRAFGGVSILVGLGLIGPLLSGLLIWIVGKFAGVKQSLKSAMVVGVFAMFPIIVEMLVNAAQALVMDESSITSRYSFSLGPARFLGGDTPATMLALVGHLDLFTIWMALLIWIGVRITGRASSAQAAVVAVVVWVLGAIPTLAQAAQQAAAE